MRKLCWLVALLPGIACAEPTDPLALLKRIQQVGESQFHYAEIRNLELASTPWHAEGLMLSGADGSLVKLQLKPSRIIMAISHERMYYWDPEHQQRHSAALNIADPAANQIKVFRAILQANIEALQSDFALTAEHQNHRWTLRLTPKADHSNDIPSVEMSGDDSRQQRQMLIRQADGDTTEYRMTPANGESKPADSLQNLLQEAIGN